MTKHQYFFYISWCTSSWHVLTREGEMSACLFSNIIVHRSTRQQDRLKTLQTETLDRHKPQNLTVLEVERSDETERRWCTASPQRTVELHPGRRKALQCAGISYLNWMDTFTFSDIILIFWWTQWIVDYSHWKAKICFEWHNCKSHIMDQNPV